MKKLQGAAVSVVGLGISNRPLVDFLLQKGALVTARDVKPRENLGALADAWEARGVRLICGENYLEHLDQEIIFRAPGIRPDIPAFSEAVKNGAILSSEMELFLDLTPAPVLGITGSDGKTTTTTLTGLMLEEECKRRGYGRVFVGGNIGTPLLPLAEDMTKDDFVVVELSSFQLQTMKRSPERAAMTNISVNHLNWHADMNEYVGAKTNIYRHAPNTMFVTNGQNETTQELAREYEKDLTLFFGEGEGYGEKRVFLKDGVICFCENGSVDPILPVEKILLPGKHNIENYMTAIGLTRGLVSRESILAVATTFRGVKHRLEMIDEIDGVTYYNSSIDSTPTRTAAALSALEPKRPIVICGGYDKKTPYEPLAKSLCAHAKAVVLTGASAPLIRKALEETDAVKQGILPVYEDGDFESAIRLAKSVAEKGDTVLLSPACASFDAFANFEERGDRFRAIINTFKQERN
jgi:UDP-N-acetylmuramoylalanine--D-glutamate ligase